MNIRCVITRALLICLASLYGSVSHATAAEPLSVAGDSVVRYPTALAIDDEAGLLFVANRRSGTVSVLDVTRRKVLNETKIGSRIESILFVPSLKRLYALEYNRHELISLSLDDENALTVEQRVQVAKYPVSLTMDSKGERCFVTSLWSRRLTAIDFHSDGSLDSSSVAMLDLPMPPNKLLQLRGSNDLVVAGNFGSKICLIDTAKMKVKSTRDIPGHNIRGLFESHDKQHLLVSHQMLNELAVTNRNDIHWGLVITNDLRWMSMKVFTDPDHSVYSGGLTHAMGTPDRAAADPAEVQMLADGTVACIVTGTNELQVGTTDELNWSRLIVGRGPTALAVSNQRKIACTANTLDDSITFVDLVSRKKLQTVSLGPKPPLSKIDRGEQLFRSGHFSRDGWMSCNSCHPDGHTNGLLNDNLTDGSFGAPKRVLSLLGRKGTEPLAWDASSDTFEQQVKASIEKAMHSPRKPTEDDIAAIAEFIRSLPAPPSIDEARDVANRVEIEQGQKVFTKLGCFSCHQPPTYTSPRTFNVGLSDELGNEAFNPPSLIGVGQREAFFHDNRATSLRFLFDSYHHPAHKADAVESLQPAEVDALLAFLRSL